jgi:hypothetical protein
MTIPCWARPPWRRMLLHNRICELHDAEYNCARAGFYLSLARAS